MASEGSVFKRADGKWCGKYKDIHEKWRYLYRKDKQTTRAALDAAIQDRDEGYVPAGKLTLGVAVEQWLEAPQKGQLRAEAGPLRYTSDVRCRQGERRRAQA